MSHRSILASVLLVAVAATASCSVATHGGAAKISPAPPPSLATSLFTPTGTWAVVVMGGPPTSNNDFWQLFARPAGISRWRLATPPGVASNGGLVIATPGAQIVVAGFRPSHALSFSPLATTHDNGATWTPGLLDAGLTNGPGALAAAPGTGRMLALLTNGTAELSTTGGTHWGRLATLRSLARSAAGRRCGLQSLSAAAFSPLGTPQLAGTCTHHSTAGIFAFTAGAWHLAGPPLPASPPRWPTRVLRLAVASNQETAVLAFGTGRNTILQGAWSYGSGRWALSPALPLGGAQVASVSLGPHGAIGAVLNGRAGVITAPGTTWQWLPFLPAGTQTLALGPGPRVNALAAAGTTFTNWAWAPGSAAWAKTQTLHVPVQYGSSG
jgi:hypothetical protein